MAVNSKADKTHGHKVKSIQGQVGVSGQQILKPTPFSSAKAASQSPAPTATGISMAGTKALQTRAKRVLAPLADPSQSITE